MRPIVFAAWTLFLPLVAGCTILDSLPLGNSPVAVGTQVDRIVVDKSARKMWLIEDDDVVKTYRVHLGFSPVGDKTEEGDGRTPEGWYRINRRNPQSRFHLSLGISYPNARDVREARKLGKDPGGDIFIHGGPRRWADRFRRDWTDGCIAVTDRQMEEIYAMVQLNTPIYIRP